MTNDEIIDRILEREGEAFTNRPSDRGGPTKFGITQRAWSEYLELGRPPVITAALPRHVRDIAEHNARDFYRAMHVEPFAWVECNSVRELVIDCSVNHGRGRAIRWLQAAADVAPDGAIGPMTRAAVNLPVVPVYARLLSTRFKFYAQIASDQPNDPDLPNLRGWINRACEFIR